METVSIVDRDNRVIGSVPRAVMRSKNLIHRASYILVFNETGALFVQKRTLTKDVYPGYWDVAAGGVVLCGEEYKTSAARELKEELGIEQVRLTHHFFHYFEDTDNRVWGSVYSCTHSGPFTLQKEEIDEGRFLTIPEILVLGNSEPFTPDGIEILHCLQTPRQGEEP